VDAVARARWRPEGNRAGVAVALEALVRLQEQALSGAIACARFGAPSFALAFSLWKERIHAKAAWLRRLHRRRRRHRSEVIQRPRVPEPHPHANVHTRSVAARAAWVNWPVWTRPDRAIAPWLQPALPCLARIRGSTGVARRCLHYLYCTRCPARLSQTAWANGPGWAHLGSNQGPLACEASALPLSYAPGRDLG
jgi:hypothetical protein